jgi:hypothetical protein
MAMENLTVAVESSDSIETDAVRHSLLEPERIREPIIGHQAPK